MKRIVMTLLAVGLLCGCKTVDGKTVPDIDRLARGAREVTAIATEQTLIAKPASRTKFLIIEAELAKLAAQPDITVENLLTILNELPFKQMQNKNAVIAFSTVRLSIALAGYSDVVVVRADQLRPIVVAFHDGMKSATDKIAP